jgi:hypothetical protein
LPRRFGIGAFFDALRRRAAGPVVLLVEQVLLTSTEGASSRNADGKRGEFDARAVARTVRDPARPNIHMRKESG